MNRRPGELGHGRAGQRVPVDLDRSVPVLMVRLGTSPLHHGTLGAVRTLGRLGVPVYAMLEDRFNPTRFSRYLRAGFVRPMTGREQTAELVEWLRDIGEDLDRRLGRPVVAIPTGDHAAVLLAEQADHLRDYFILPKMAPGLPRMLASKMGLQGLCTTHGVPTPVTVAPGSPAEALSMADEFGYPVVLKNPEPWKRSPGPELAATMLIRSREELISLLEGWPSMPPLALQQYLPAHRCQDWIVHAYCDGDGRCLVDFTGVKLRSQPRDAGPTALAITVRNEALATMAGDFFQRIGFAGIADLDWRFDAQDGAYRLLDFNPRLGAQFRLFETDAGVDVVRAMHLDLTRRPVPSGRQVDGRRIVVENLDAKARVSYWRNGGTPAAPVPTTGTELAWLALDDPLPGLVMTARVVGPAAGRQVRGLTARSGDRHLDGSRTA